MATVFLSYTHDSDAHRERVGLLAGKLRADLTAAGVSVVSDHICSAGGPDEGWDVWSEKNAEHDDILLPIFNATYLKCWEGEHPPGTRAGGTAEAKIIRRRIYDAGGSVAFARTVVFDGADKALIPARIRGLHCFHGENDYAGLLDWVRLAIGLLSTTSTPSPIAATTCAAAWPTAPSTYEKPIADREDEWAALTDLLSDSPKARALVYCADTNLGKTTLIDAATDYARTLLGAASVIRVDFKGGFTCAEVYGEFRLALKFSEKDDPYQLRGALRALTCPTLLLFDTYEQAPDEARKLIQQHILRDLLHTPMLRVILAGQPKGFSDFAAIGLANSVHKLCLAPITKPHWLSYVQRCHAHVEERHVETLCLATGGVPGVFMTLLATLSTSLRPPSP